MSYISDVTLLDAWAGDVAKLNAWLKEHDQRQPEIRRVPDKKFSDAMGGTEVYCSSIWGAALNYMPHEFLDVLRDPATWSNPCIWAVDIEGEHKYAGIVTFKRHGGCDVTHIEAHDA